MTTTASRKNEDEGVPTVPEQDCSFPRAGKKGNCEQIDEGGLIGHIDDLSTVGELPSGLDAFAALAIAKYIKEETGLTIFGFDVLFESLSGSFFVIDVNYFPSCKNVTGVQTAIRDALFEKITYFTGVTSRTRKSPLSTGESNE